VGQPLDQTLAVSSPLTMTIMCVWIIFYIYIYIFHHYCVRLHNNNNITYDVFIQVFEQCY